jgi:hypothetical protein
MKAAQTGHLLIIGETWLNETHTSASLQNYSIIARKDRTTKKTGGVLAYAREGIECTAIQAPDPQEAHGVDECRRLM